jgi:hypothetical protein
MKAGHGESTAAGLQAMTVGRDTATNTRIAKAGISPRPRRRRATCASAPAMPQASA